METLNINQLNNEVINLKREIAELRKFLTEDMKFAIRTELAWQEHDRGKFKSMPANKFLEQLEKC